MGEISSLLYGYWLYAKWILQYEAKKLSLEEVKVTLGYKMGEGVKGLCSYFQFDTRLYKMYSISPYALLVWCSTKFILQHIDEIKRMDDFVFYVLFWRLNCHGLNAQSTKRKTNFNRTKNYVVLFELNELMNLYVWTMQLLWGSCVYCVQWTCFLTTGSKIS